MTDLESLKDAYNIILKPIQLEFYNDLFISYLIGKNYVFEIKSLKDKLDLKYKDFKTLSTNDKINNKIIPYKTKYNLLKNKLWHNTYHSDLQLYYCCNEFLYHKKLFKLLDKTVKNIKYIVFGEFFKEETDKKSRKQINEAAKIYNIKIDREFVMVDDKFDYDLDKYQEDSLFLRIVGILTEIKLDLFMDFLRFLHKTLYNSPKNRTIIFDIPYHYKIELVFDYLSYISNFFEKVICFHDKFRKTHNLTVILFKKKGNNIDKNIFKKNNVYKLYNKDLITDTYISKNMNKITKSEYNNAYILTSILTMKDKKYKNMILEKLDHMKQFIKIEYETKIHE